MQYGKRICATLKQVRKQIAEANGIPYEVTECHHEGNCKGTCPKCEAELRYIENQLAKLQTAGKAASIVGLALGVAATFSSCTNSEQQSTNTPEVTNSGVEEYQIDGEPTIEGLPYTESNTLPPPPPPPSEDELDGDIIYVGEYDESEEGMMDGIISQPEGAEFPGGQEALMKFLGDNIKYPKELGEQTVQGRVSVAFTIEEDGNITNITELKSPHELLTQEVIRVIKLMPKWQPATRSGKPVSTIYILQVTLKTEDN